MELLIFNRDGLPGGYRRGDVVLVMPDGYPWADDERDPQKFRIIKVPGEPPENYRDELLREHRARLINPGTPLGRREWFMPDLNGNATLSKPVFLAAIRSREGRLPPGAV